MCGIAGIYINDIPERNPLFMEPELSKCRSMLETLQFRGPDEQHIKNFGETVLGHARLSIIDLNTGSQPVYNEDGSVAVIFNGEIYNFNKLRVELQRRNHFFRSRTDTEVIVHLYEEVGVDLFSQLEGMFALILYDRKKKIFLAGRDRMGEKPLLYWQGENKLIVASELKALLRYPDINRVVNEDALALYLSSMYVPAPHCIIDGIHKLPPAHYLIVEEGKSRIVQYWRPHLQINWDITEEEVVEKFIVLFRNAVESRKIADVPLGVFLSGGIDSSAVTAFMAMRCHETVKTFSVGFAEEVDERPYARMVANRYQTDHTEIFISQKVEDVLADVMQYYDEPFGDSSAIPTYLVAKEARQYVKVVLTGDGGDELFAGYGSYLNQRDLIRGRLATKLLKIAKRSLPGRVGFNALDKIYARNGNSRSWEHWLGVRTIFPPDQLNQLMRTDNTKDSSLFFQENKWLAINEKDPLSIAFAHDLNFYLPDDLLKKVDMASMRASLECRAPFLDHHLVEFAMSIPPPMKVKGGELKYVLKRALKPYLPEEILYRRKVGFGAPVASWMRGQLHEMISDILQPGCLSEVYLNRKGIDRVITDFYQQTSSDFRIAFKLWLLFVFELWLRNYLKK